MQLFFARLTVFVVFLTKYIVIIIKFISSLFIPSFKNCITA